MFGICLSMPCVFMKSGAIWTRFHQISMDWSPFHDNFSIYHKKYFAHETGLESCCDLHSTLKMIRKKSSTTLVFIIFFGIFFKNSALFLHKRPFDTIIGCWDPSHHVDLVESYNFVYITSRQRHKGLPEPFHFIYLY